MSDGCCPPGSTPAAEPSVFPTKLNGGVSALPSGLRIYSISPATAQTAALSGLDVSAVVVAYDIYGFDAGRSKLACDMLAAAGHMAVLPDFFEGESCEGEECAAMGKVPWITKQSDWTKVGAQLCEEVLPFLRARGVTKVGILGICWGSYVGLKASQTGEFAACASVHPSHSKVAGFRGEQEDEEWSKVDCAQLIIPTGGDPPQTKEGGANQRLARAAGQECDVLELSEMNHGFYTRGDLADAAVARDVEAASRKLLEFFDKHLK